MEKQTRTRLPQETKDYIVKMILEEGIQVRAMARKFEIGESTIQSWLKAVRDKRNKTQQVRYSLQRKNMKRCKPSMKKSCVH